MSHRLATSLSVHPEAVAGVLLEWEIFETRGAGVFVSFALLAEKVCAVKMALNKKRAKPEHAQGEAEFVVAWSRVPGCAVAQQRREGESFLVIGTIISTPLRPPSSRGLLAVRVLLGVLGSLLSVRLCVMGEITQWRGGRLVRTSHAESGPVRAAGKAFTSPPWFVFLKQALYHLR